MQSGSLTHPHNSDLTTSCADDVCMILWSDLPLACPFPGTTLWNGHPRIYLPIHHSGRESCTYCGTVYILQAPVPGEPTPKFANIDIEKCYRQALEEATRKIGQVTEESLA